jgi:hypothetical protein
VRYDLPPGLAPQEERAVRAALDQYVRLASVRPSAWALAGRAVGLGLGALQIRNQSTHPWVETGLNPYTRLGTDSLLGRGDAK